MSETYNFMCVPNHPQHLNQRRGFLRPLVLKNICRAGANDYLLEISIDHDGRICYCDFNITLEMPVASDNTPDINHMDLFKLEGRLIAGCSLCFCCIARWILLRWGADRNRLIKKKENPMTLKEKLDNQKKKAAAAAPKESLDVMQRATEDLEASGIMDRAKKVGDIAPDFTLNNAHGQAVSLTQKLSAGSVVLGFYRGGW